jgi:hypothetical protein
MTGLWWIRERKQHRPSTSRTGDQNVQPRVGLKKESGWSVHHRPFLIHSTAILWRDSCAHSHRTYCNFASRDAAMVMAQEPNSARLRRSSSSRGNLDESRVLLIYTGGTCSLSFIYSSWMLILQSNIGTIGMMPSERGYIPVPKALFYW